MSFGRGPAGRTPHARGPGANISALGPFADFVADVEADRVHLIHLSPRDPDTGTILDLYRTDWPWDGPPAAPTRLGSSIQIATSIFQQGFIANPISVPRVGVIDIGGDDSPSLGADDAEDVSPTDFDAWTAYQWKERAVEILLGSPDFSFSQFQPVLVGVVADVQWGRDRFSLVVVDRFHELSTKLIQTERYGGGGGRDGGTDLDGKTRPLLFGDGYNVPLQLVDAANDVYEVHSRETEGPLSGTNEGVHDAGVLLTAAGSVADVYAWTPVSGSWVYETGASGTYVRLGAPPNGLVTADWKGDKDPTLGYSNAPGHIYRVIAQWKGGLADADLDLQSFTEFATATTAPIGLFVPSGSVSTVPQALAQILPSTVLGFAEFTRTGQLRIARLEFDTSVATFTPDPRNIDRAPTETPYWRRSLGWRRAWVRQDEDTLGSIPAALREFVTKDYRESVAEDATVQTGFPSAQDLTIPTLYRDESDASTEAARQLALVKLQRDRYRVKVYGQQFLRRLGETVTLQTPLYGLSAGRDCLILGIEEDTSDRSTVLELWGGP
ncbi:MAG: hypothetical protein ACQGVC_18295 [Myxococcota bacterium]